MLTSFPALTVTTSLEVNNLKHKNYTSLSIFIVRYGLNKIKLAFDAQYKTIILSLLN